MGTNACDVKSQARARGGTYVLHALTVRKLNTRPRGRDGALFLQERSPMANRSFLVFQINVAQKGFSHSAVVSLATLACYAPLLFPNNVVKLHRLRLATQWFIGLAITHKFLLSPIIVINTSLSSICNGCFTTTWIRSLCTLPQFQISVIVVYFPEAPPKFLRISIARPNCGFQLYCATNCVQIRV